MLDAETKRRIDTCRDILVGKVPDPKSQVEQITIALIYKFMDDMDAEAEELGGARSFFSGDYARYGWAKLMRSGLGGHETLALYAEAIAKMPENPGIPALFRDIFKNAYLPYRDPETLRSFLKEINVFTYDHSEKLGDAFEYLLSVLGSQGDAGQFRTPRHIIDFMVEIIDPQKHESILDPACGTAGFLISAWKHILKSNSELQITNDEQNPALIRNSQFVINTLTPAERANLAANIHGYDISPDMVRLSLVNMYLHGFTDPHIVEYDTLTSEEKWNETADVILANPPFMSPKGGIKPHKRFSIQAKRSEVLFVDYMAEHLSPQGRAAIIVPEGIIFQGQTAYKQLREMLVKNSLVAVVSLPAGVFNPYAGVKTSILILDKRLAKATDSVLFVKIENDGFGLGAQRRAVTGSGLPDAVELIKNYKLRITNGEDVKAVMSNSQFVIVPKARIAANGEYNLSGERYREGAINAGLKWPLLPIGELCVVERGASPRPIHDFITDAPNGVNWIKIGDAKVGAKYITSTKERVTPEGAAKSRRVKPGDFILSNSMSFGRPYVMATDGCIHDGWLLLRDQSDRLDQDFLYNILGSKPVFAQFEQAATGGVVNNLNSQIVRGVKIPLPPLDVQRKIVAEIEGYQKIIDGARAVLDNYRPHIPIHPEWPMVPIGDVCTVNPRKSEINDMDENTVVSFVPMADLNENEISFQPINTKKLVEVTSSYTYFRNGDVLLAKVTPCFENGKAGIAKGLVNGIGFGSSEFYVLRSDGRILPEWIYIAITTATFRETAIAQMTGTGGLQRVPRSVVESYQIPLPPFATQQSIVAEIEAEQALVAANRELIERFEKKIQTTIARIWGEEANTVD